MNNNGSYRVGIGVEERVIYELFELEYLKFLLLLIGLFLREFFSFKSVIRCY